MSHSRAALLVCACALVINATAEAAPAPPRRAENKGLYIKFYYETGFDCHCDHEQCNLVETSGNQKESEMVQEKTIIVRRLPNAYFYPFSLWPLPKYPVRDQEESHEAFQYRRSLKRPQIRRKER